MLNLKHKPFDYEESESPSEIVSRCESQISEELSGILERFPSDVERSELEYRTLFIFYGLTDPEEDDARKDIIRASYRAYSWVSSMFNDDTISFEEWHQLKNYILALTEDVLQMAEN